MCLDRTAAMRHYFLVVDGKFVHSFTDIKQMSEEMKEGLGQLAGMLQFYMKEEIHDVSQLVPGLNLLHLFGQVSLFLTY